MDVMLTSSHDAHAAHLAIEIFNRYYSEVDSLNALPAETVASISLRLVM